MEYTLCVFLIEERNKFIAEDKYPLVSEITDG